MDNRFIETLMKYIHDNITEKDKLLEPETVNNWVQHEAVEQRHLPDYGTFREALRRCVEDKITPILTKFLLDIDYNSNLLIFPNGQQQLWVDLCAETIYGNKIDKGDANARKEQSTFISRFPFSYQIFKMLETLIKPSINQGIV